MCRIDKQYGAALIVAPIACYLYTSLFPHSPFTLNQILSDYTLLFLILLVYPIIEELAFRGVIQEYIASKIQTGDILFVLSPANVVTSILFSGIHLVHYPAYWALLVFFPSLIFGYFKDRYGCILPSIGLHIIYNAVALFMIGKIG